LFSIATATALTNVAAIVTTTTTTPTTITPQTAAFMGLPI
jgi:hypothetical protein